VNVFSELDVGVDQNKDYLCVTGGEQEMKHSLKVPVCQISYVYNDTTSEALALEVIRISLKLRLKSQDR
jgi:hypothetical protein